MVKFLSGLLHLLLSSSSVIKCCITDFEVVEKQTPVHIFFIVRNTLSQMLQNCKGQFFAGGQFREFTNPTDKMGTFARAMSQISSNPSTAPQGNGLDANVLNKNLFEQIQLALAVKMCLNGPQQ